MAALKPPCSMEHIVKLRKIALADIEAEQLKIKAAREANRKKASIIVKVALPLFLARIYLINVFVDTFLVDPFPRPSALQ
jgi:hypothetical protein